jgi:hypothetical protein
MAGFPCEEQVCLSSKTLENMGNFSKEKISRELRKKDLQTKKRPPCGGPFKLLDRIVT